LVSVAYDMLAKVWQPSNLYGEALLGKLKGHNHPLVSVENLPDKPFVVTVDTKNTIMIWDVRSLTCA
jgi:WD40 repeat protein